LLATELLVIALDLSGHGHSDRRTQYSVQRWSAEVLTVARAVSSSPPILVGHSMGGIVAAQTAVEHGAALAAAFMLDAPLWPNAPAPEHPLLIRSGPPRTYPTREAAVERFRLVPPQASLCPWYVDHIARHSLSATEDGWTWSFDSAIFDPSGGPGSIERYEGQLEESRCPMVMIMGERSYLVADCTPPSFADIPVIHIPDAGHHLMLDQPVALVSVLRGLLSTYVPTRRSPVRSIRNIGSLDP
jgi:pimeloyl-ACP methyl ester carboxylesterase